MVLQPVSQLDTSKALDWQKKALDQIFILDAQGASTFVTLNNNAQLITNPQQQNYDTVLPIGLFAPDKEQEGIAAVRKAVPTTKQWEDDVIRDKVMEPVRAHLKAHRGIDYAFAPVAEEQKRIYQVFAEINKIPGISEQMVESGSRFFIGGGITTAGVFHPEHTTYVGMLDPRNTKNIYIAGFAAFDPVLLSEAVTEETGHAYHSYKLRLDSEVRDFRRLDFEQQVEKLVEVRKALSSLSLKQSQGHPADVARQDRYTPQEWAILPRLNVIAKERGVAVPVILGTVRHDINDILAATSDAYKKFNNAQKMDELTTKSLVKVASFKRIFHDDMSFLLQMNGPVETYDIASYNFRVAEKAYGKKYSEVQRESAAEFNQQIEAMTMGTAREH